jgi:hypothetical protein
MADPKFEEDFPLSQEILAAIGFVASQWAHLEDCIGIVMAFLLKTNHHDFRAITANLTAISKIDSFAATANLYLTGKNLASVNDFVKRAQGLSGERNRIVHGFWYPIKSKPNVADRIAYVARDGGFSQKWEEVSAARMLGTGRQIADVRRDVQLFLERLEKYRRARRKASRKTLRRPSLPTPVRRTHLSR